MKVKYLSGDSSPAILLQILFKMFESPTPSKLSLSSQDVPKATRQEKLLTK